MAKLVKANVMIALDVRLKLLGLLDIRQYVL